MLAPHPEFCERMLVQTIRYWRAWLSQCEYTGRWRETVYRSALCLKLLTFEPTGKAGRFNWGAMGLLDTVLQARSSLHRP